MAAVKIWIGGRADYFVLQWLQVWLWIRWVVAGNRNVLFLIYSPLNMTYFCWSFIFVLNLLRPNLVGARIWKSWGKFRKQTLIYRYVAMNLTRRPKCGSAIKLVNNKCQTSIFCCTCLTLIWTEFNFPNPIAGRRIDRRDTYWRTFWKWWICWDSSWWSIQYLCEGTERKGTYTCQL